MRWFFRAVGLIFLLFIGAMVAGYFSDDTLRVERDIRINASADDVFVHLDDLELAARWSPWHSGAPDPVYGASVEGAGATVMWREGESAEAAAINSQTIIASQAPEFVQATLLLSGESSSVTYALLPVEGGDGVDVFINFETDLGDFPYMQRLLTGGRTRVLARDFDAALARLKTIVETEP